MARRAYGTEDKAARRRAILAAAAGLFVAGSGELPPVAQVAEAAGLAKGTVYLYFRTKEEVFSALLQEGWGEVIALVEEVFAPTPGGGRERVPVFLSRFVAHVAQHPELLRLDALGHGVLMKNLEPAALAAFKAELFARVEAGGRGGGAGARSAAGPRRPAPDAHLRPDARAVAVLRRDGRVRLRAARPVRLGLSRRTGRGSGRVLARRARGLTGALPSRG